MREIRGDAKNVRALLGSTKYAIDYYQREYRWETKHVVELIEDLTERFLDDFEVDHERQAVEGYGHYFLGSIIISNKDGLKYIIDGQQRLTTLTLILIYIHRQIADQDQKAQLADLIYSQKYGKRSFNLDVPERNDCMEALFEGNPIDENSESESVVNILRRYQDIEEQLANEFSDKALPFFADWLIENVHLVEITAFSDADAYAIFETMNDRGLSLTPTDMLKGYLLANITDTQRRNNASDVWRKRVTVLRNIDKEEDADAIKAWLRSQYAKTIRERKRGAKPRDFDLIGTEFHRWVRDHEDALGLSGSETFADFIRQDFAFYSRWYEKIRLAATTLTESLESIYFNAQNNFTLQYPVLLAPLCQDDSDAVIRRKLRIVSAYLDILIARRIWNWKSNSYSAMQYSMFRLAILKIRHKPVQELVEFLTERLAEDELTFADNDRFALHGRNKRHIHRLLARMTAYIEAQSGREFRYEEYMKRSGKNGYEVEHIWANHPERHTDEFDHPNDFSDYRNRIGGLLLLPKSFNASYGDNPYSVKRNHYLKQNLLSQSLHEKAYEHDPGFQRFLKKSELPFKPHSEFNKSDLDERQVLYRKLAEQIWDPERLAEEAEA